MAIFRGALSWKVAIMHSMMVGPRMLNTMHGTPSLFHLSFKKILRERDSLAMAEKYPERRKNRAMKKVWFMMLKGTMRREEKEKPGGYKGL